MVIRAGRRRPLLVGAILIAVALALLVVGGLAVRERQAEQHRARGRSIFVGHADLPGTLAGHSSALPRLATRCMNCHEAVDATSTAAAAAGRDPVSGRPYAAQLDRAWLSSPRSRHGGPPTTYDAASLCTLLRTGVDAGHVVVSTVMPRYAVSDAQCLDLHAYLLTR